MKYEKAFSKLKTHEKLKKVHFLEKLEWNLIVN